MRSLTFYKQYSKLIPIIGKLVVGTPEPYNYLIKSINEFYSQKELVKKIKNSGFSNVEYRNLFNGVSCNTFWVENLNA